MRDDPRRSEAIRLGKQLRAVREATRLSLAEVEAKSFGKLKPSALGCYERGERELSIVRLSRLARVYGVSIQDLLPPEPSPADDMTCPVEAHEGEDKETTAASREQLRFNLERLANSPTPEAALLLRYLRQIRDRRQGNQSGPLLTIRNEDAQIVGWLATLERGGNIRGPFPGQVSTEPL